MKSVRNSIRFILAAALVAVLSTNMYFTALVLPGTERCLADRDYNAEMEERKTLPIQSNEIEGWPDGPVVGAESAILMDMDTQTILYAKNIDEKWYPASTTKILTCLLAVQNCTMEEIITFSHDAIYDVPGDGSKLGDLDEGDTMLMEQALYCVLVQSANEVATAVGEHVAEKLGMEKNAASFTALMNDKAAQLGCKNSHFTNANGLYDDNHYTSAYDLALIGCEFFSNELLCKMSSTPSYHFRLNDEEEDRWIASKNQLLKGKPYEYKYLLGSKTGFVSQSRQTLVSAAEKNGMRLVCVVFAEETPYQFEDTITLFRYGFENFQKWSVNDNELKYKVNTMDLLGDTPPLLSVESDAFIILPNTAEFSDAVSSLAYNEAQGTNVAATIHYTYLDINVGECNVVFSKADTQPYGFSFHYEEPSPPETLQDAPEGEMSAPTEVPDMPENGTNVVFVNVKTVLFGISVAVAAVLLIVMVISIIKSYNFSPRGQSKRRRRVRRRESRALKRSARRSARQRRKSIRENKRRH